MMDKPPEEMAPEVDAEGGQVERKSTVSKRSNTSKNSQRSVKSNGRQNAAPAPFVKKGN